MDKVMHNRTAVISGGSQGIGLATAAAFLERGYRVAICGRSADKLAAARTTLGADASTLLTRACDLTVRDDVSAFAKTVDDWTGGRLDVLVNNAGQFVPGGVVADPENILPDLLAANLYSAVWLTRELLPQLRNANASAQILNVSSVAALEAYPPGPAYSVSKFAMRGYSVALREELRPEGIRVVDIVPGATYTPSWEASGVDPHRLMAAEDVALAIAHATELSSRASYELAILRPTAAD